MKVDSFVSAYMRRNHPRVPWDMPRSEDGWHFRAQHPETGKIVRHVFRMQRVFHGDEARVARELADRIDTLLAPDQSWRLHADYV